MIIKYIFILNLNAGKGKKNIDLKNAIEDACIVAKVDYKVYLTEYIGNATELVKQCILERKDGEKLRIYGCGGDGTFSEVINGAVSAFEILGRINDSTVEIGCIPIGTGNDFVRNFKNSEFFGDITKQLLADKVNIDCYRISDPYSDTVKYGINMINIGFDCDVVAKTSEIKKKSLIPHGLAYFAGVFVMLKENPGKTLSVIRPDGSITKKEYQLVSVANGGFCGGGFHSAPKSSLTDGLLDVSLIDKVKRRELLKILLSYRKGTHLETKLGKRIVNYSQTKEISLIFDKPSNVCIDGEIITMSAVNLKVIPNAISFLVPVGCSIK